MYSLLDVILDSGPVHLPKLSDWFVASTSGWDASAGTPAVKLSIDAASITIPIQRIRGGKVIDGAILNGQGYGLSSGIGVQLPAFNLNFSRDNLPGGGSEVLLSPFAHDPMVAQDFAGVCYAISLETSAGARAVGGTALVFADRPGFSSILPTSINAAALCWGLNLSTQLVGGGGEVAIYLLRVAS